MLIDEDEPLFWRQYGWDTAKMLMLGSWEVCAVAGGNVELHQKYAQQRHETWEVFNRVFWDDVRNLDD